MDKVPEGARHLFPEYRLETLDPGEGQTANIILERLLDLGGEEALDWLFRRYPQERIRSWVVERGFRRLSRRSFAYWRLIFDIQRYEVPPWVKPTAEACPDPAPGLWGR